MHPTTLPISRNRIIAIIATAAAGFSLAAATGNTGPAHALAAAPPRAPAVLPGVTRADLLRDDLNIPGREIIQTRVDFAPGASAPRHSHPGEETAYVLTGALEYRLDGRPPVTVRAGEALFIPAGAVHAARNVGEGSASELATYIVDKSRPLITLAE